ncbi:transposase [Okeania sp. SIO3I5]|uniref:RNA-guided endonuclease InsQ/TnpB family protein n=1 Tax=Okeania sp. SIO3I5 TaxID=2607805 RepID=UPI0025F7BBD2|nr:transposase [Okeania sp. SIO3I5]
MGCEDTKKKPVRKYGKNPYKKSQKVQPNSILKVPVWPSKELHKIWKQWLAAYRWVYNQCVEFFNHQRTLPKGKSLDQVIQSRQFQPENEWTKCLGKTRQEAVCEAELAYKQVKAANNNKSFQLRYRSCRQKSQTIQFKNDAYRDGTWFPKKVKGMVFCTAIGYQIPHNCDYGTELVYQRGQWFACFPQYIEPTTTGSDKVIALDPGNRAFLTGYDGENVLEIGKGDIGRLNRLCSHLDNLLSRAALSKNQRQRYQMRKAATRMRSKIQQLVKDLHNKVASVLTNSYKLIFLPTYETSQMVLKSSRKINRKSVRNMLSWSHGKFASHLEQIAARKGVLVVRCNEAYTSKTCTNCGHVHKNLGGSKIYKCPQCGHIIARDINGARNIMLRALQATAFTVVNDSIVISDAISTEAL